MKIRNLFIVLIVLFFRDSCLSCSLPKKMPWLDEETILADDFPNRVLQLYLLKRLEKAMNIIRLVQDKSLFPLLCRQACGQNCIIFPDSSVFEDERVRGCKEKIEQTRSLQPLLNLWNEMRRRNVYQQRTHFSIELLREFSIVILGVYRAVFIVCFPGMQALQKNVIMDVIWKLFHDLTSLHAFELLTLIEQLTRHVPRLLEKYELMNKELTWEQWFKKYWWLVPVAVVAVGLEVIFIYQVATGKRRPLSHHSSHLFLKQNEKA